MKKSKKPPKLRSAKKRGFLQVNKKCKNACDFAERMFVSAREVKSGEKWVSFANREVKSGEKWILGLQQYVKSWR